MSVSEPRSKGASTSSATSQDSPRRVRRRWSAVIAVLAVMTSGVGVVVTAPPAAAYPSSTVSLIGHGYGHGRGMGQWGAFGYALAGTPWKAIVSHYYSGSTPTLTTPAQEGTDIRVALTENDGNDVIVTSASGFTVAGHHFSGGQAVLMHDNGGGSWDLSSGSSCAGPWTGWATGVSSPEAVPDTNSNIGASNAAALALQLCQVGGNMYVRGFARGRLQQQRPGADGQHPPARGLHRGSGAQRVAGVLGARSGRQVRTATPGASSRWRHKPLRPAPT